MWETPQSGQQDANKMRTNDGTARGAANKVPHFCRRFGARQDRRSPRRRGNSSEYTAEREKEFGMASVSKERVDQLFENYLLALAGVDQCSDSAPDTVINRLAANLDEAERAFSDAAADGLLDESAPLDAEMRELSKANERSRTGLRDGKPIADLLADLEQGTAHALRALKVALDPSR
jgi:hypothetical protein